MTDHARLLVGALAVLLYADVAVFFSSSARTTFLFVAFERNSLSLHLKETKRPGCSYTCGWLAQTDGPPLLL